MSLPNTCVVLLILVPAAPSRIIFLFILICMEQRYRFELSDTRIVNGPVGPAVSRICLVAFVAVLHF
jgi:hypothetical protein